MGRVVGVGVAVLACVVLVPAAAWAQQTSSAVIAGTVRDTSGAVLPGVTVEASSPALIEKVRTAVTEDQGQYRITDLRPGTYVITFTLPGFAVVRREGLELPANFTATVNIDMRVGGLEETVTVTGASPVVDVQTLSTATRVTNEVLDSLPTSRELAEVMAFNPGVTVAPASRSTGGQDPGQNTRMPAHGARADDSRLMNDGMRFNVQASGSTTVYINPLASQEMLVETGGMGGSAESDTGGVTLNVVPKDGGNDFTAAFFTNYANQSMRSDNVTEELQAKGLATAPKLVNLYDINGAFGGPLKRDKLWFFSAYRKWGTSREAIDFYPNLLRNQIVEWGGSRVQPRYAPDTSTPGEGTVTNWSKYIRLTYQASQNNKLTLSHDRQPNCDCPDVAVANSAPETQTDNSRQPQGITNSTWTWVASSRLLFEAGVGVMYGRNDRGPMGTFNRKYDDYFGGPAATIRDIRVQETTTGFVWGAPQQGTANSTTTRSTGSARGSASYITGAHQFKAGFFWTRHARQESFDRGQISQVEYRLTNGVPASLFQFAGSAEAPITWNLDHRETNFYIQDRMTVRRLTLNGGVRVSRWHSQAPGPIEIPADRFLPARQLAHAECIPCWNDWEPRFGAAYDVFGTGRTAVKASIGKYVSLDFQPTMIQPLIPVQASVQSVTRSWNDANRNFIPECDLANKLANGECGQVSDLNFGGVRPTAAGADPDFIEGWGKRPYTWRTMVGLDQQLFPNVGISATYHHVTYGNFFVLANQALGPADFDPYCFTAPVDSRLPGGGGNQICGLADVTPAKFGLVSQKFTHASNYGKMTETYDGGQVDVNWRRRGALVTGGVAIGNSRAGGGGRQNRCFVVSNPQELYNCEIDPPFSPAYKFGAAYPLPWDVQVSAVWQNTPGAPISANLQVPLASIQPSLGRPLSGGVRQVAIALVPPESMFGPRINTLDLRFTKGIRVGRVRAQGIVDFYNVMNSSTIISFNGNYGPNWQNPVDILDGRMAKVGLKVDF